MVKPSQLDDPQVSAYAWARYRRMMKWMTGMAVIAAIIALSILRYRHPHASIHLFIAAGAGVMMAVLLGAALMSLVFLSAGTGHDDAIENPLDEEEFGQ